MSHFTVLVVGDNVPEALAPFHQFECTGEEAFIQDIDLTEEARAEYQQDTTKMYRYLRTMKMVDAYDDRFFREPTEQETKDIGPLSGSGSRDGFTFSPRIGTTVRDIVPKFIFYLKAGKRLRYRLRS